MERAVMRRILEASEPGFEELRVQFAQARVQERRLTGAGFFTTFEVPDSTPRSSLKSPVGNVSASIEGLKHGAGFVLWLKDGRMETLEGFSYEESWRPTGQEAFVLAPVSATTSL
jgi:hypothetical protein